MSSRAIDPHMGEVKGDDGIRLTFDYGGSEPDVDPADVMSSNLKISGDMKQSCTIQGREVGTRVSISTT